MLLDGSLDRKILLGIIDSLSAGFRLLIRRLDLLILPVLLDLWLWFMPPLSIAPLLDQLAAFYGRATEVEGFPPELTEMSTQVSEALALLGETSNLWTLLANTWLMHMPSMMAAMGVLPEASSILVDHLLAASGLVIVLSLCGVFVGTLFLELVAHALPIGNGEKPQGLSHFASSLFRHFGRIVAFILFAGLGLLLAYVPISFAVGLVALLSPALSSILVLLLGVATMLLFFHLYFVVAAIILDDLPILAAVRQSFQLVRRGFLTTFGFVFLTGFITIGFTLILAPVAQNVPAGTAVAILINSFLGAGLAIALFIFYRTHLLRLAEETSELGSQV